MVSWRKVHPKAITPKISLNCHPENSPFWEMIHPHHSKIAPLLMMFSPQNSHSWKPAIQGLDMTLWFSNPLPPWPSELFISEVFEGMQNIHELGARISQLFSGVHPLIHTEFLLFASNCCQDEKNTPYVKVHAKN